MELLSLIEARYSCRNFADRPVERALVRKICAAAAQAPSACNSQPWKMHALFGEKKAALARAVAGLGLNGHAADAAAVIAVEETPAKYLSRFDGAVRPNAWAEIDIGILAAHIVLLAEESGLQSCILGYAADPAAVQDILQTTNPVPLFIALGYAEEGKPMPKKNRKPLAEVFAEEE